MFGPRCVEAGARLAGKTGTPSFSFDRLTLTQARARCRDNPRDEDCRERPMKLYVAAVRSALAPQGRYDKVIAVMSERNWYLPEARLPAMVRERVHGSASASDPDNIATDIAMRIIDAEWVSSRAQP